MFPTTQMNLIREMFPVLFFCLICTIRIIEMKFNSIKMNHRLYVIPFFLTFIANVK